MRNLIGRIKTRIKKGRIESVKAQEIGAQAQVNGIQPESQDKPGKLVVLGNESVFSQELIDYAIEMALRMSYEVVALNAAPLSCETFKLFSSSHNEVCHEFRKLSEQNVQPFKEEILRNSISFTHIVKFCDAEQALAELRNEVGEIDFIVSDGHPDQQVEIQTEGESIKSEIFVYSMI